MVIERTDRDQARGRGWDRWRDSWAAGGGEEVSDPEFEGKYLMRDPDALAAVAARLGVRSLLSFLAHPVQSGAEVVETDGLVAWGSPVVWHDSPDGLRTVAALIDHLAAREDASVGQGERTGILAALRALEAALQRAHETGKRWHLAVSC